MDEMWDYVAVDIETTGLDPGKHEIIEIGAIRYKDGKEQESYSSFIKPNMLLPAKITELTGITGGMLLNERPKETVLREFFDFVGEDVLLGHNILFDYSFLKTALEHLGFTFKRKGIDTLFICRSIHKDLKSKSLENMCGFYGIQNEQAHRAYHDAKTAACLYEKMKEKFSECIPEAFRARPLEYEVKKREEITPKQKKYLTALSRYHQIAMSQQIDSLSKSEASRLIDGIISEYGLMV